MSDSEVRKMEYLKNMMDNEVLYAAKIEDKERKEGDIPRIMLGEMHFGEDGKPIWCLHMLCDDTKYIKKDPEEYLGQISTVSKVPQYFKYGGAEKWLHKSNYMIISKATYDRYRIEASEGALSFRKISSEIAQSHREYYENRAKIEKKQNSSVGKETMKIRYFDERRVVALNCIAEFAKKSQDYKNLLELLNEYGDVGLTEVYHAITGSASMQMEYIKSGKLKCSDSQIETAKKMLEYERNFLDLPIKGRRDYFNVAIAFFYNCSEVDNDELYRRLRKNWHRIKQITSIKQAVSEIERVYNYRNRDKIHVKQGYFNKKDKR